MGLLSILYLLVTRPDDARILLQYKLWHEPKRDITTPSEFVTSGYDRKSMRRCWEFLDMTSRSFSAVIKELDGDLARVICLFYLTLRGLDTIEDDMTIPDEIKQPLLRSFHQKLTTPGWTYGGNGPDEKDRQLLVEFNEVVEEIGNLNPMEREVIIDITQKMQTGMADFAHKAILSPTGAYIDDIQDFDLYCHYVAGLVGEGLSRLFVATEKELPLIGTQLVLSNSMGLLLQKTNILRDIREDIDEGRFFWPKSVWEAHGFTHPAQLRDTDKRTEAMWVLSAMTLDALRHCLDSLDYLTLLRNQSVFNFCAIPAVMAIATLQLCFMNSAVFDRNIKIRKAEAVGIIMKCTNPRDVAYLFRDFARQLHKKARPNDPYFVKISITCGKIEQWVEHHYPSFIAVPTTRPSSSAPSEAALTGRTEGILVDARRRIVKRHQALLTAKQAQEEAANPGAAAAAAAAANGARVGRGVRDGGAIGGDTLPWQFFLVVAGGFAVVCGLSLGVLLLAAKWGYLT